MRKLSLIALLTACAHSRDAVVPVVFIHGNGANAGQWRHQVEHFGKSRRVVAIDLPGMGPAPKPHGTAFASSTWMLY